MKRKSRSCWSLLTASADRLSHVLRAGWAQAGAWHLTLLSLMLEAHQHLLWAPSELHDDVNGKNDAWNVAQDGQQDADQEVL